MKILKRFHIFLRRVTSRYLIRSISLSPRELSVWNNKDKISSIPIGSVYCVDFFA